MFGAEHQPLRFLHHQLVSAYYIVKEQKGHSINKASNGTGSFGQNRNKRLNKANHIKGFRLPTATPKPRAEGSSPSAPAKKKQSPFW